MRARRMIMAVRRMMSSSRMLRLRFNPKIDSNSNLPRLKRQRPQYSLQSTQNHRSNHRNGPNQLKLTLAVR